MLSVGSSPADNAGKDDLVGSGNNLYDNRASVETFTATEGRNVDLQGMFCLGFAEGLTMGVMAADIQRASKTFCEPDNVTNLQVVRIIMKYIADHPDKAHEPLVEARSIRKSFRARSRHLGSSAAGYG
jgi:Rap1a immunity proteins